MPEDEQENPPAPALTLPDLPNVSSLFAKQQAILGNMTCVMKEIGFVSTNNLSPIRAVPLIV